jgi:hydroxyacylglutathione hydrolase
LASSPEEGARALFASAQKIKSLPDYVEVLPGAFSGSVCGRSLSGKPLSTIGFERKYNQAFRIDDRDAFVRFMLQDIPPSPPRAEQIRAVNLGIRQTLD